MLEKSNEADIISSLEEIVMDSAKAKAVYDASKMSMGMDVSPVDLLNIDMFATRSVNDVNKITLPAIMSIAVSNQYIIFPVSILGLLLWPITVRWFPATFKTKWH